MSWIKITQYLPGDNRKIQIWNNPPYDGAGLNQRDGNHFGYFNKETGQWFEDNFGQRELKYVTHWAEMLGKPDDL